MKNRLKTYLVIILALFMIMPIKANDINYVSIIHPNEGNIIDIYHIADVVDGKYQIDDDFKDYQIDYTANDSEALNKNANALKGYIDYAKVKPDYEGKIENGLFNLELADGLYLIIAKDMLGNGGYYQNSAILLNVDTSYDINIKYDFVSEDDSFTLKLMKVFSDDAYYDSNLKIKAVLFEDDQVYDSYILSKDNNWQVSIPNLSKFHEYTLYEVDQDNFYKQVMLEDNVLVLENKVINPNIKDEDDKLTQAGQNWLICLFLAFLGCLFTMLGFISVKRGKVDEKG